MTTTKTPTDQTKPSPSKEPRTGPETSADTGSRVPTGSLSPNPANPRGTLGDLTEMVRSIRTHGVLQPLLVLPASNDGKYRIVAGHRRHAAALTAGLDTVPVVITNLNEAETLEVILIENGLREDLTLSEEISTLEALMTLDVGDTPRKLCARIGKSQRWIKDRLAVTVLPTQWRDRLDSKELSLSAAVAASTLADLGPEHLDQVCHELTHGRRNYRDPANHVEFYRKDLKVRQEAKTLAAKLTAKGFIVYDDKAETPDRARTLRTLGLDSDQAKAHAKEPCHAVGVRPGYNAGPQLTPYCNDPKRHRTSRTKPAESTIAAPPAPGHSQTNAAQQHERRKGRIARLAAGTELFARTTKKPKLDELRNLALYSLITSTGEGAKKHAERILGIKANDADNTTDQLAAVAAQSPQTLVRVASAIACGIAEERAYHSESSMVTGYMSFLVHNGWEPDATTADILDRHGD